MSQVQQTVIDIDALTDRELDAAVAEFVLGWAIQENELWHAENGDRVWLYRFSTDERYAAQVEAEIERRRLVVEYVLALEIVLGDEGVYACDTPSVSLTWPLIRAKPAQRCRAALKAVMDE